MGWGCRASESPRYVNTRANLSTKQTPLLPPKKHIHAGKRIYVPDRTLEHMVSHPEVHTTNDIYMYMCIYMCVYYNYIFKIIVDIYYVCIYYIYMCVYGMYVCVCLYVPICTYVCVRA